MSPVDGVRRRFRPGPKTWLAATAVALSIATLHAAAPTPYYKYLTQRLHLRPDVAHCALALSRAVRNSLRFDSFVQSDGEVMAAKLQQHKSIFSIGQPARVDTIVSMPGSLHDKARSRWVGVKTRCGLRQHKVKVVEFRLKDGTVLRKKLQAGLDASPSARLASGQVNDL